MHNQVIMADAATKKGGLFVDLHLFLDSLLKYLHSGGVLFIINSSCVVASRGSSVTKNATNKTLHFV